VFDGTDHDGDPVAVLRVIGRRMVSMMLSETGLAMYRMVIAEAAKFPDLAQGFFRAGPARAIAALAGWLAAQTRLGHLSVADPDFAAEQFFNLCQAGLVLRRRLEMIPNPSDNEIDQVVAAAIKLFLAAYGVAGCR
jgi:hypothetical protein